LGFPTTYEQGQPSASSSEWTAENAEGEENIEFPQGKSLKYLWTFANRYIINTVNLREIEWVKTTRSSYEFKKKGRQAPYDIAFIGRVVQHSLAQPNDYSKYDILVEIDD